MKLACTPWLVGMCWSLSEANSQTKNEWAESDDWNGEWDLSPRSKLCSGVGVGGGIRPFEIWAVLRIWGWGEQVARLQQLLKSPKPSCPRSELCSELRVGGRKQPGHFWKPEEGRTCPLDSLPWLFGCPCSCRDIQSAEACHWNGHSCLLPALRCWEKAGCAL